MLPDDLPVPQWRILPGGPIQSDDTAAAKMTKRELFAAMAMQGLLASGYTQQTFGDLQFDAVRHADALLAELAKGGAS